MAIHFEQTDADSGEVWKYEVIELESLKKAQLWYWWPAVGVWEVGHSKDIPEGFDLTSVSDVMQAYVFGEIDHAEYNRILP